MFDYNEVKLVFFCYYSDLVVSFCSIFLSKDFKCVIEYYRVEKENI